MLADHYRSYRVLSTACAAPSFNEPNQYPRLPHEVRNPHAYVSKPSSTRSPHDGSSGGDYWGANFNVHGVHRSARGSFGPHRRPNTMSRASSDSHHRASRQSNTKRASRPPISARDREPTGQNGEHTIRLSKLPPSLSEVGVHRPLHGDVQVSACQPTPGKPHADLTYASFTLSSDRKRSVESLGGLDCGGGRLAVALIHTPPYVEVSKSAVDNSDRRLGSTTMAQATGGPLIVDGANSARPRYKGRHHTVDSDVSDDGDSHTLPSDSDDNSGSSSSDKLISNVTKKAISRS